MENELAKKETLIQELDKYAASYSTAWAKLKESLPEPDKADDSHVEKVNVLRGKGKSRYKEINEKRLDSTRELDAFKKKLIDKEAILDESKPVSPLYEAKGYVEKVMQARLERERKQKEEVEAVLAKEKAIAEMPIRFESELKRLILAKETEIKTQLQTELMLSGTDEELDVVEKKLRVQNVLLPDDYKALANQAVKAIGATPELLPAIMARNVEIKSGLVLAFNVSMNSFQKELITQVAPRRGQKVDEKAAENAVASIQREAQEQQEKITKESEKAADVAALEVGMSATVVETKVKTNVVAQPKNMGEWALVIGYCLKMGLVLNKEWCDKNLKPLLTALNKEARNGTKITGVTYVEEVKV